MPVDSSRLVGLIRDHLPSDEPILIALSGGGDSTALLHLCLRAGLKVQAATVDHRLRPESAAEAARVAADCAALGVPHQVLVWQHDAVAGNLMDQARRARMALLGDWARAQGTRVIALGHTRDDQAETLLMGLSRAAGLAGLSGMRPAWTDAGLRFCRPLLAAGRQDLRDWLRREGIDWIDDPTNDNDRFTRIKARKALAALAPLGITAARLADVAGHLAEAQAALVAQVTAAARDHVTETAGALQFAAGLWTEPAEVQRQTVAAGVLWLNSAPYAPRAAELERLLHALAQGTDATLAGCRARRGWLTREPRALGGPVPVGTLWDGRWRVTGPQGEVRALGAEGLRRLADWRKLGLTREILLVTPAVWQGDTLLSAPLAGFPSDWQAKLDRPFHLFGIGD